MAGSRATSPLTKKHKKHKLAKFNQLIDYVHECFKCHFCANRIHISCAGPYTREQAAFIQSKNEFTFACSDSKDRIRSPQFAKELEGVASATAQFSAQIQQFKSGYEISPQEMNSKMIIQEKQLQDLLRKDQLKDTIGFASGSGKRRKDDEDELHGFILTKEILESMVSGHSIDAATNSNVSINPGKKISRIDKKYSQSKYPS